MSFYHSILRNTIIIMSLFLKTARFNLAILTFFLQLHVYYHNSEEKLNCVWIIFYSDAKRVSYSWINRYINVNLPWKGNSFRVPVCCAMECAVILHSSVNIYSMFKEVHIRIYRWETGWTLNLCFRFTISLFCFVTCTEIMQTFDERFWNVDAL